MTDNLIVINVDPWETRVAIVENGLIAELFVERPKARTAVGNIYRGRVTRVLPGMQAAFVDIGMERHAFLHASDLLHPEGVSKKASIRELVKEGQMIIVQVVKDQIGTKGCRVSQEVSLAGRHLVYMPLAGKGGVSRKIDDEEERKRLADVLAGIAVEQGALIARTAASGISETALQADARFLIEQWEVIYRQFRSARKPGLLFADLSLPMRMVRDKLNDSVARIIVDDMGVFEQLRTLIARLVPERLDVLEHYGGEEPIFDAFGIESEIRRALDRVVTLPSGGTLVIDQGEALTAVDVNTGKFVGKGLDDQEQTILKTNLEAVDEIAYQVRFRNIGGLIVIDLIDMERSSHRRKVVERLKQALRSDRAKTSVTSISRFGLLEMTRERVTESLGRTLHERCPYCDGTGSILSAVTVANDACREVLRRHDSRWERVELTVHPAVAQVLREHADTTVAVLRDRLGVAVDVKESRNLHVEQFHVSGRRAADKKGES